ncbi:MAG TPA: hypothetical protein VIT20_09630 [Propionibacteriaceae bacterium]
MKRPVDVVSLLMGLLLTVIAGAALWLTYVGPLNWGQIKIAAPFALVLAGAIGLALSRNRT